MERRIIAANIRLNEDGLREASQRLANDGNHLEELIQDMQTVINGLSDSWEGDAAVAYQQQFSELRPGLDKTRELVANISNQITQALQAVQELDAKIGAVFNS